MAVAKMEQKDYLRFSHPSLQISDFSLPAVESILSEKPVIHHRKSLHMQDTEKKQIEYMVTRHQHAETPFSKI